MSPNPRKTFFKGRREFRGLQEAATAHLEEDDVVENESFDYNVELYHRNSDSEVVYDQDFFNDDRFLTIKKYMHLTDTYN